MFRYEFTSKSLKQLQKLDPPIQKRIIDKLDGICIYEKLPGNIHQLTDYKLGQYRIRIGEYRIISDLEDNNLIILKLGHGKISKNELQNPQKFKELS